jgi:hypothetical protein
LHAQTDSACSFSYKLYKNEKVYIVAIPLITMNNNVLDSRETKNFGICQICAREIKAKSGIIAHHGYKRPGQGWQTSSCIGARNLPYEKSRDVIIQAIRIVQRFIENQKHIIEQVKAGKVAVPNGLRNPFIQPTDKFYSIIQKEYLVNLDYEVRKATLEIERLQKRYDEWKLIEVKK